MRASRAQIYDVEIDKVNKPFLPVAAGEISAPLAWALVGGSGVLGLAITAAFFSPLIFQVCVCAVFARQSCLLGIARTRKRQSTHKWEADAERTREGNVEGALAQDRDSARPA